MLCCCQAELGKLENDLAEMRRYRAELQAAHERHVAVLDAARSRRKDHAAALAELEPVIAEHVRGLHFNFTTG